MKVTYHIPTEQYGFVAYDFEDEECETLPSYDRLKYQVMLGAGRGIDELSFSKLVDKYMATGTMLPEEHEVLNVVQKYAINTLKKFKKRPNGENK